MRELAIQFTGLSVISLCSITKRCENSNIFFPDSSDPFVTFFIPINAPEPTATISAWFSILFILSRGTSAQILSAIVQRVMIAMVAVFCRSTTKNNAMHVQHFFILSANSIKSFRVLTQKCTPVPLIEPVEIVSIDQSILIARKRNQSVRFVQRLRNRMSLNPTFWHVPTSNRNLLSAAIL